MMRYIKRRARKTGSLLPWTKTSQEYSDFLPKDAGGIVVAKIYKRPVDETLTIFRKYYQSIKAEDVKGNLVIITPEGVRIRRSAR